MPRASAERVVGLDDQLEARGADVELDDPEVGAAEREPERMADRAVDLVPAQPTDGRNDPRGDSDRMPGRQRGSHLVRLAGRRAARRTAGAWAGTAVARGDRARQAGGAGARGGRGRPGARRHRRDRSHKIERDAMKTPRYLRK